MRRFLCLIILLTLAGCASDIPRPIREAPDTDIRPAQALSHAESLLGSPVRWGGTIARVENRKEETWIELVEFPLTKEGRPRITEASGGRFLARFKGFLDPEVYAHKRSLTVAGSLEAPVTQPIGEHPYRFPVVAVSSHYLWAPEPNVVHYYYYYYSPFWYDPWYPWRYTTPPPTRKK